MIPCHITQHVLFAIYRTYIDQHRTHTKTPGIEIYDCQSINQLNERSISHVGGRPGYKLPTEL